jgi:acylaminoacyl-peptidase
MFYRFLALGLMVVAAGAGRQPLTTDSYWEWRTVSAPAISPDGRQVVYAVEWADRMADAYRSQLWVADTATGENRPLTGAGAWRDSAPQWSPDGKRVAFVSNRTGKSQIWVRWMASGEQAPVTSLDTGAAEFQWSPDGNWIVFTSRLEDAPPQWTPKGKAAPKGAQWTEPASVITSLKWRRDGVGGQGIVAPGVTAAFLVRAEGGAARRITPEGLTVSGKPALTPDGRHLVLAGHLAAEGDLKLYPDDLFVVETETGKSRKLSALSGNEASPVVSPDGRRVAFIGFEDQGNAYHVAPLWVVELEGGAAPRRLAPRLDNDVLFPQWRADSRAVLGVVAARGDSHLWEFPLEGAGRQLTLGTGRLATQYAGSDAYTVNAAGQVAATWSSPREPKEVVSFSLANPAKLNRVSQINAGMAEKYEWGETEELTATSFDGRKVQGWLLKPPRFDAARKYPLILDIHGGPHAMYGTEFQTQMQMYAARGFVVLYVNPRGSSGYGEEFGNVIHGKYPGDDYHDLMAAVDAAVAKGWVDPSKLCVTGGSGGGILTAWIVTQTDRFAAAVSQYPVINWITQFGSSDIPLVMERWMKGTPWGNTRQYLERSPLFHVERVKTPTLLVTGEEDWRTPIGQTEEFYVALKRRGVETAMVRFPKEPHGIRGAFPSHRVAKVDYILAWMERFTGRGQ